MGSTTKQDSQRATKVCRDACTIRRFCLRTGLVGGEYGVWGGLPEKALRALRRDLLRELGGRPLHGSAELDDVLDKHAPDSREPKARP
ncbi:hypothetical protein BS329_15450 [Amycolatopsis coloradensis]|uniref:4Fe-4S Wbl-type domain-containing protein n=1 Tax=Amycolatopsis coloradensis TaxID=76021 RepID=A0A1R0KU78_9PSEU|nr:WhiB family transcriptional regulator [Amycolatopsis coloradensis]OLZ51660.1 hypothetical protein BS329_15450 [Amycolatopsis coloradensis]